MGRARLAAIPSQGLRLCLAHPFIQVHTRGWKAVLKRILEELKGKKVGGRAKKTTLAAAAASVAAAGMLRGGPGRFMRFPLCSSCLRSTFPGTWTVGIIVLRSAFSIERRAGGPVLVAPALPPALTLSPSPRAGMDPSAAPAVGTQDPDGMTPAQAFELLRAVGIQNEIVGADVGAWAGAGRWGPASCKQKHNNLTFFSS